MQYPAFLPENGTIGFVAPSFGCDTEPYRSAFENAQANLENTGFSLKLGPNCYAGDGIGISTSPDKCGKEINEFYTDPETDVLIACGGGELMCETLDYVDFQLLKNSRPKWFCGFSDNTNLCFLLATLCDTASLYGPCAPAYGMEPWHPVLEDSLNLLMGKTNTIQGYGSWEKESLKDEENPLVPYNITEETCIRRIWPGHVLPDRIAFSGRLLGGCLDILENLSGTVYDNVPDFCEKYKEDGFVWFMESCDLNVFGMRRALWHLKRCGWLKYVKGFLIGRPYCYGQEIMGLDAYEAVLGVLSEFEVPVLMDVDLGHLPPSMPMVVGALADIVCENNTLTIRYRFS